MQTFVSPNAFLEIHCVQTPGYLHSLYSACHHLYVQWISVEYPLLVSLAWSFDSQKYITLPIIISVCGVWQVETVGM